MNKIVAGLMSGTSADGIDAALTCITGSGDQVKLEVLDFVTIPYSLTLKNKIFQAMESDQFNAAHISSLNFELGKVFAEAVQQLCKHAGYECKDLDLIGSHGQTIAHIPDDATDFQRSTLQIGEPAVIAYETRTPVVSNFRVMDMAAGGQGAPLIAYFDYVLCRHVDHSIALLNLGGIANLTVIPAGAALQDVVAFDTGPANMIIDALAQKFYGQSYDRNGQFAARGSIDKTLLKSLMSDPYLKMKPPKSTGREHYGRNFVEQIATQRSDLAPDDLIATATYFTVKTIIENYEVFVLPNGCIDELLVSGGGSHNPMIMKWLNELLPGVSVKVMNNKLLNADAKEAAAFALLAYENVNGCPVNVPNATGAKEGLILGNYTPFFGN
ncbi:MAG: anhydro-N-acetylmuramic acid kinase [Neobacillus sp.]|nr:anhydro-N-acetylmuramic acid kinase [Neobacillus sp.]